MTAYMGGKKRLANDIHSVILDTVEKTGFKGTQYFEPFLGMGSVFVKFASDGFDSTGCDANKDLMLMWKAIHNGWIPKNHCSREKFEALKHSKIHSAERGFYGIACSFYGGWFSSYHPTRSQAAYNGIMKVRDVMRQKNVHFYPGDSYTSFEPTNCIVYCDPPYKTTPNGVNKFLNDFDSEAFWKTMRKWSEPKRRNLVFISEEHAPSDFISIWKKTVKRTIGNANGKIAQEKLFIMK